MRIVKTLLERIEKSREVRVEHSTYSREIADPSLPIYPALRMPKDIQPFATLEEVLEDQEFLYGELNCKDKLKLIFQATYGGGHMLADMKKTRDCLFEEWSAIDSSSDEPFAERNLFEDDEIRDRGHDVHRSGRGDDALGPMRC